MTVGMRRSQSPHTANRNPPPPSTAHNPPPPSTATYMLQWPQGNDNIALNHKGLEPMYCVELETPRSDGCEPHASEPPQKRTNCSK
eukprot:7710794-Alexandrium_andersonii.AAC.1